MDSTLINSIYEQNPWLRNPDAPLIPNNNSLISREGAEDLLNPEWDSIWTIITGPRQAGKTTLGKCLCEALIKSGRFTNLLYLNCDYGNIREWLNNSVFLSDIDNIFELDNYILFIDEAQRLESPGLTLKIVVDLKRPIKLIASGSSQLEIKSKITEHLTGRHIERIVFPLSSREIAFPKYLHSSLQYGTYPQVYLSDEKERFLTELFKSYIQKDIIEFLKIGKPEIIQKLLTLLAHCSGQLLNINQLATDCGIHHTTVKHYLDVLEKTYVIDLISPFAGNKRTEITSNPICYFIDCGFRNIALNNTTPIESRTDAGLLVESFVLQEMKKFIVNNQLNWKIHYWRTKGGAEVDFILKINADTIIPIEIKYRNMKSMQIHRGFHSFVDAYSPKLGIIITKNQTGKRHLEKCDIHFIPLDTLSKLFTLLKKQ